MIAHHVQQILSSR